MRSLAAIALALVALFVSGLALADSEARQGNDWVRLAATPCTDVKVLASIRGAGEDPADYRAARAEFQGAAYGACWRPLMDRHMIFMRYDDGDQGLVPFGDLKPMKDA